MFLVRLHHKKSNVKAVERMTVFTFPKISTGLWIQSVIRFVFSGGSRISQMGKGRS